MSCILFSYDYIIHCIPYPWGNWTLSSQLPSSLSHLLHTILSTLPSNQPLSASPCHCINAALHLPVDFHNSNQNRSPYLSLSFCQSTLYTITRVIFEKHHLVLSIPALTLSSSPCSLQARSNFLHHTWPFVIWKQYNLYWICPFCHSDPLLLPSSVPWRLTSVDRTSGLPTFLSSLFHQWGARGDWEERKARHDYGTVRLGSYPPSVSQGITAAFSQVALSIQVPRCRKPFSLLALLAFLIFVNSSVTKLFSVYPVYHLFPARSLTNIPTNIFSSFSSLVLVCWFVHRTSATSYSHRTLSNSVNFYFCLDHATTFQKIQVIGKDRGGEKWHIQGGKKMCTMFFFILNEYSFI